MHGAVRPAQSKQHHAMTTTTSKSSPTWGDELGPVMRANREQLHDALCPHHCHGVGSGGAVDGGHQERPAGLDQRGQGGCKSLRLADVLHNLQSADCIKLPACSEVLQQSTPGMTSSVNCCQTGHSQHSLSYSKSHQTAGQQQDFPAEQRSIIHCAKKQYTCMLYGCLAHAAFTEQSPAPSPTCAR